jgi:muconate cycloisomerase
MVRSQITSIKLYRLAIPMRHRVTHAAAGRNVADPIVVVVNLADGTVGYGETLARPYVTGETPASVFDVVEHAFLPALVAFRPANFPEALELTDSLPLEDSDGDTATAARAGVELALLDAYSRFFKRPLSEVVGWLGLPGFGEPGSVGKVRFSGVLAEEHTAGLKKRWRLMRLFGLRDQKLKVGFDNDAERLRLVDRLMGAAIRAQKGTLRLDANGAWTEDRAEEILGFCAELNLPLECVEQPLPKGSEDELSRLRGETGTAIMLDESLVTRLDAEELIEAGGADWFNLRLAKNGGLMETIRLAALARKHGIKLVLGSLVGETGILAAAARKFLENVPGVRFAEGNFGTFLLSEDLTARSIRFSCGGRWKPLKGLGWGVEVLPERLARLSPEKPLNYAL